MCDHMTFLDWFVSRIVLSTWCLKIDWAVMLALTCERLAGSLQYLGLGLVCCLEFVVHVFPLVLASAIMFHFSCLLRPEAAINCHDGGSSVAGEKVANHMLWNYSITCYIAIWIFVDRFQVSSQECLSALSWWHCSVELCVPKEKHSIALARVMAA